MIETQESIHERGLIKDRFTEDFMQTRPSLKDLENFIKDSVRDESKRIELIEKLQKNRPKGKTHLPKEGEFKGYHKLYGVLMEIYLYLEKEYTKDLML